MQAEAEPHRIDIRVYYEDTDFSGFVYHANYLHFLERGRSDFLRARGIKQSALHRDEAGLVFVVARLTIDYLRPARMDDVLSVATSLLVARGPVLKLRQAVERDGETLASAEVTVVAIRDGRTVRLPASIKAALDGA